jgi:hypothetical protein
MRFTDCVGWLRRPCWGCLSPVAAVAAPTAPTQATAALWRSMKARARCRAPCRYTRGYTLGESFAAGSHFVGWTDLVIGNPLAHPYPVR